MKFFGVIAILLSVVGSIATVIDAFHKLGGTPMPFGQGVILMCVGLITIQLAEKGSPR